MVLFHRSHMISYECMLRSLYTWTFCDHQ